MAVSSLILLLGERNKKMIKINKDGDGFQIKTNCLDEREFMDSLVKLLIEMIQTGCFENDWEFQLTYILPLIVDICCKYRGYKNNVAESKILIAGDIQVTESPTMFELTDRGKFNYSPILPLGENNNG